MQTHTVTAVFMDGTSEVLNVHEGKVGYRTSREQLRQIERKLRAGDTDHEGKRVWKVTLSEDGGVGVFDSVTAICEHGVNYTSPCVYCRLHV